jgi:hypothetical protein
VFNLTDLYDPKEILYKEGCMDLDIMKREKGNRAAKEEDAVKLCVSERVCR